MQLTLNTPDIVSPERKYSRANKSAFILLTVECQHGGIMGVRCTRQTVIGIFFSCDEVIQVISKGKKREKESELGSP